MGSKLHFTGPVTRPGRAAARHFRLISITLSASACLTAFAPAQAAPVAKMQAAESTLHGYYEKLRTQLHWVPIRVGSREVLTPDANSRILLARSAAERAHLADVGLDYRDVYGVINAETSWFPRDGLGRNGVTSEGLAQFEPSTAKALGVRNANDPVEAVHAAAQLLREAAQWSAHRIAGLRLGGTERAARLREGISVYYNLSTAARQRWNGSSAALPVETLRHIQNVRAGAQQAERIAAGTGRVELPAIVASAQAAAPRSEHASARRGSAAPHPVGTIEWASGPRAGRHVVWSNGSITRESNGRVRWTSNGPANG
jgi:hypothetical protein